MRSSVAVVILSMMAAGPVVAAPKQEVAAPKQEVAADAQAVEAVENTIFKKEVTHNQNLVVTRRRVPRIIDPVVEARLQEWLKTQPPGTQIIAPEYAYLYSFILLTTEEKGEADIERLLWTFRKEEFGAGPKFLDAVVGENTLAYIYDESDKAFANVVRMGKDISEMGFAASRLDIKRRGYLSEDTRVTSATFKGSLKEHTLVVETINAVGMTVRFELKTEDGKDRWQRLPDPQPEPKAENPTPPARDVPPQQ